MISENRASRSSAISTRGPARSTCGGTPRAFDVDRSRQGGGRVEGAWRSGGRASEMVSATRFGGERG